MKRISRIFVLAAPTLTFVMPLQAAPQPRPAGQPSLVEQARADCRWVDNKWTYQRGDKVLVCRPDRPSGRGWSWHREGNRFGWWHAGRREWHYNGW